MVTLPKVLVNISDDLEFDRVKRYAILLVSYLKILYEGKLRGEISYPTSSEPIVQLCKSLSDGMSKYNNDEPNIWDIPLFDIPYFSFKTKDEYKDSKFILNKFEEQIMYLNKRLIQSNRSIISDPSPLYQLLVSFRQGIRQFEILLM